MKDKIVDELFTLLQRKLQKQPVHEAVMIRIERLSQSLLLSGMSDCKIPHDVLDCHFQLKQNGGNKDVKVSQIKKDHRWLVLVKANDEACLKSLLDCFHILNEDIQLALEITYPAFVNVSSDFLYAEECAESACEKTWPVQCQVNIEDKFKREFVLKLLRAHELSLSTMHAEAVAVEKGILLKCLLVPEQSSKQQCQQWRVTMENLVKDKVDCVIRSEHSIQPQHFDVMGEEWFTNIAICNGVDFHYERDKGVLVIVGSKTSVESTYEECLRHQKSVTDLSVVKIKVAINCSPEKAKLLMLLDYHKLETVNTLYDELDNVFVLEGKKSHVAIHQCFLSLKIDQFSSERLTLPYMGLLRRPAFEKFIKSTLQKHKICYHIESQHVLLCAESSELDSNAKALFLKLFHQDSRHLDKEFANVKVGLKEFLKSVEKKFDPLFYFCFHKDNCLLEWTVLSDCANQVAEEITTWLDNNVHRKKIISLSRGQAQLIMSYAKEHELIGNCKYEDNCIVISGRECDLLAAVREVEKLKRQMVRQFIVTDELGLPAYLRKNKDIFRHLVSKNLSSIIFLEEDGNPGSQVESSSACKKFSVNNVQILVASKDTVSLSSVGAIIGCMNFPLLSGSYSFSIWLWQCGDQADMLAIKNYFSEFRETCPSDSILLVTEILPFKPLIYAVGQRYDAKKESEIRNIWHSCIWHALEKACKVGATSIAIPGIRCGSAYPSKLAASCLVMTVVAFIRENPDALRSVHFVSQSETVCMEFTKALVNFLNTPEVKSVNFFSKLKPNLFGSLTPASASISQSAVISQCLTDNFAIKINKVIIQLVFGNIADEKTSAIVNTTAENLKLSTGTVSKSIMAAAGLGLQEECDQIMLRNGGKPVISPAFAITSGHNLKTCSRIYHSSFGRWDHQKGHLQEFLVNVMDDAEQHGVSSISIPAIGTGGLGYSPKDVANATYAAIDQVAPSLVKLKDINIVLYHKDLETVQAFKDFVKLRQSGRVPNSRRRGKVQYITQED